jgi:hypothetical protein
MNNCQSEGGCFRAVPPQIGLEAGIGFYKYPDARVVDAGDMWVAGSNCWVSGDSFTIGTNGTGACLNISNTGVVEVPFYITTQEVMVDTLRARTAEFINIDDNVVITGSLTVNGYVESGATVDHNPFWVAGKVNGGGSITVLCSAGKNGFTVTRPAGSPTGVYKITWTDPHPRGNDYVIQLTSQITGFIKVLFSPVPDNTSFHISMQNSSLALANEMFYFTVLD